MSGGWCYLHTNGDLIYKRDLGDGPPGSEGSDFVRYVWQFSADRAAGWKIILEAAALNANPERIKELAVKWGCDLRDLTEMLARTKNPSNLVRDGLVRFLGIVGVDAESWFDWLAKTPKGAEPDFATMPQAREGTWKP